MQYALGVVLAVGCTAGEWRGTPPDSPSPDTVPVRTPTAPSTEPTDTGSTPATEVGPVCSVTDNALRARCTFELDAPAPLRLEVTALDTGLVERTQTSPASTTRHDVLLTMLRPDTDYEVAALHLDTEDPVFEVVPFTTGSMPPLLDFQMTSAGTSSVPFVGMADPCSISAFAMVFDTVTGAPVWYEDLDPQGSLGPSHMLRFTERGTVLANTGPRVVEVDREGQVVFELVKGADYLVDLHHDLFEAGGMLYLLYVDQEGQLDGVLVFDQERAEVVADWHSADHLTPPANLPTDWLHINSLHVDRQGGLLMSSFKMHTLLRVDGNPTSPTFGNVTWRLAGGGPTDLGNDFAVHWNGLTPRAFSQPHMATRLADGDLMLLDNGFGRALRFELDEILHEAVLVASYPTAEQLPCGPQGTAIETSSGHVLVGCAEGALQEYTPTGAPVWSAEMVCPDGILATLDRVYPVEGW